LDNTHFLAHAFSIVPVLKNTRAALHALGSAQPARLCAGGSSQKVWCRPVGITAAKDGSLLISEDGDKTIWRVSYK
jgi:hypothetical protein